MQPLLQDLRYGARVLAKKPGFTLMAVLTLALGIGANAAIFSVINAVLISPLPFHDSGSLVAVGQTSPKNRTALGSVSHRNLMDWRAQSQVFADIGAYHGRVFTLTGEQETVRLRGTVVTHNLFGLLGAAPTLGRGFSPEDDQPGGGSSGRPAILSWHSWQRYFGGDPQAIGRAIKLNGDVYTIIGVMPAQFAFPIQVQPTEIWTSTARDAENTGPGSIMVSRGYLVWRAIARLKPGATLAQAQTEMSIIASNLATQFPDSNREVGATVMPLLDSLVNNIRPTLLLLLGAVGLVLLIACVNIANLLLERALTRQKEITIRLALGASRGRIVRQLFTESLILAVLGGVAGVTLAWWGMELLVKLSPEGIARITETRLDVRVLAFAALVSVLSGALFGIAPAFAASGVRLGESLKEGGRGSTDSARMSRLRGLLVVVEVALALVLLMSGGLLVRSLIKLQRTELGFNTKDMLTFNMAISDEALGQEIGPHQIAEFYRQVEERLKTLPGVTSVSVAASLPLSGGVSSTGLKIEGRPTEPGRAPMGQINAVGVDYFRTLGIPLRRGREFTAHDDLNGPPVMIINETLAKQLFPNEDPLGKRIEPGFSTVGGTVLREIVGVVGDIRPTGPRDEPDLGFYFAQAQMPMSEMSVVVKTAGAPQELINPIRSELQAFNKGVPLYQFRTLDEYFARVIAASRFNTLLIGLFALVALVLTTVGIYGVLSCTVSQSTHELGVRMALGAQASDILRLVIGQGMTMVALGIGFGAAGTFALLRLMSNWLYGVEATDPLTFAGVALLLACVAFGACYFPARRATKVDPMIALRCE